MIHKLQATNFLFLLGPGLQLALGATGEEARGNEDSLYEAAELYS